MASWKWFAIGGAVLLLARGRAAAEAEPPATLVGAHFALVPHFDDPRVAREALDAVEAAWEPATSLFGTPRTNTPLRVHLYRTEADYARAEQALTAGAFRKNLAFSHHATSSAHVAAQPDVSDTFLRALGLTAQTKRLLVHEAAHLVRFAAVPDFVDHPGWFADGAALWVADRVARARGWSPGLEKDPLTSTAIVDAREEVAKIGEHPLERLLYDDMRDVEMYARYGLRLLMFTWLAEGPYRADLDRLLARARTPEPGKTTEDRFHEALRATVLPAGAAGLERSKAWRTWIDGLRPEWDQVIRSLEVRGQGLDEEAVQAAFDDVNAIAWGTAPASPPYVWEADVEVLPGGNGQMNVLLARRGNDFLSVALVAGSGVTLFRHLEKGDRWDTLAVAPASALRLGWRSRVVVTVADAVAVSVDGVEVLRHPAAGLDLAGPVGLGAQAGSAGIWSRRRLR